MKAGLLAALALATAVPSAATATAAGKERPDCAEVNAGVCQCENGNQIDEYRAAKYVEQCFLGNDSEGNPKKFSFYPWLEQKHNCPIVGEIGAGELQNLWAKGQECWADQNPCDALPGEAMQAALGQCGENAVKKEQEEEVNGEEEEVQPVQPKNPKLERGKPKLTEALATGKGANIFQEPTPFDEKLSTPKSIGDALWADAGETAKSLGSALGVDDGSIHFSSSASGPSIKDEDFEKEARILATKEFDVKGGGVVEYYVRYNDPEAAPGGVQCKTKVDAMLKEFARQKRCEDEKKAKEACELNAAKLCNGHGKPVYESGCSQNGAWRRGADNTGSHNMKKVRWRFVVVGLSSFFAFSPRLIPTPPTPRESRRPSAPTTRYDTTHHHQACDEETAQFNCNNPHNFGRNQMSRCNHCTCEPTYEGAHCTRAFRGAPVWSRSVGDPHPRTFNGLYTNLYDEGEFIWWRHPVIPMESHLVTTPRSSVAINKAFSVKRCKSVDEKNRFDQNGKKCNRKDCFPKMVAPCEVITKGDAAITYSIDKNNRVTCGQLKYNCLYVSGHTIYNRDCDTMSEFNGAMMRLQFGSSNIYKDSYLWVKSLNDGTGGGVAGHWGASDFGDTVSSSGTRGGNRMYSETFYDRYRIKKKENSHWGVCGTRMWKSSLNYRRSLIDLDEQSQSKVSKSGLRANKAALISKAKAQAGAQAGARVAMFSGLRFKAEALDLSEISIKSKRAIQGKEEKKLVGDCDPKDEVEGNTVCSALATKWCTTHIQTCSGLATPDAGSLVACVKDMVKVGDTADGKAATLKLACDVVKEDFDVAIETAVEEATEQKQDLAGAWPLLLPEPTDMVLQWCTKDCDADSEPEKCLNMRSDPSLATMENKEHPVKAMNKACGTGDKGLGGWHTFKAVQMNEYGDEIVKKWKRFTTRIPEEAVVAAKTLNGDKLRIRFYQHSHAACFCCNALAIDQIRVQTGGWPVRIIADDNFQLYADGKLIGDGRWAKRENSIDVNRFRIPTSTRVVGIYVAGRPKARDGRGPSQASPMSGVLASIADSLVTSASWACTSVGVGDQKWRETASTRDFKEFLTWPYAAEEGSNDPGKNYHTYIVFCSVHGRVDWLLSIFVVLARSALTLRPFTFSFLLLLLYFHASILLQTGTDPWGQIPGIAKSARWIYSHSSTKKDNTAAFCRIDTDRAWLSYSDEHVTATRWSCKNGKDLQSAFVVALNSENTRYSFPGFQVATQDASSSIEQSNNGWARIYQRWQWFEWDTWHGHDRDRRRHHHKEQRIQEQRTMVLRFKLKDMMDKATDGALIKVAKLRLYTNRAGVPMSVCSLETPQNAGNDALKSDWKTVSYNIAQAATKTGCISVTSVENDFVKIDVTNWLRIWRTDPEQNIGLYITTPSKSGDVDVAAPDMPAKSADLRPRLSLSCHGDQADSEMVFKSAGAGTTLRVAAGAGGDATKADAGISAEKSVSAATAGPNFAAAHNRGKVNAPWPKGLEDVSWLENAKLTEDFDIYAGGTPDILKQK
jgi:hypothetical protein